MTSFTYHNRETAPEQSRESIDKSVALFGFLPNLHAVMAEAPGILDAYHALWGMFGGSSFSPLQQQVVLMTTNFENSCHYCVPGHTYIMTASEMPQEVIDGLRNGTTLADDKLQALRVFTRELIENRGHVGDDRLETFIQAGYSKRQALEVIVGVALKVLSNYTNALAHTEVDEPVKKFAWQKPSA